MSKDVLKLALAALECKDGWGSSIRSQKDRAITAIKQALEQPVQEPVAQLGDGILWCDTCRSVQETTHHTNPNDRDVWCKGEAKYLQGPFYTTPPAAPVQPVDIATLVEGMEVSINVSTGEHDSGNRLFGSVTLVQENQGSKHGLILLVQEPEANFKTAAPPAAQPSVPLTVDCIGHALDLEAQAKRVESQTVERAMLSAANVLRIIAAQNI